MKSLKVEYQVKASKLAETLPVIARFIIAAQADKQHVAYYLGYQYKNEPTKFVHFMKFNTQEDESYHKTAGYTKEFVEALYPNCRIQPVFEEVLELDAELIQPS